MTTEITYWERVAKTRWGSYTTQIENHIIHKAAKLAGPPSVAIEVGCEGGRWSQLLSDRGWKMICTDIDLNVLRTCKSKIPNSMCILVKNDMIKIPCKEESVSLVLCMEVFPVIHSDWFLQEAHNILTKKGILVGVVQNRYSLRAVANNTLRLINTRRRSCNKYNYTTPYNIWKKKLLHIGFEIKYEEGFCWFPFSRNSDFILIPNLTKIEKYIGLRKCVNFSPWIAFIAQKTH